MVVLNISKCEKCDNKCNAIYFQYNFNNWTSGNNNIDKFIQSTQLSAHGNAAKALEWIPYNKLYDIKYIAESDFGKVYRARWIDGYINVWDNNSQNWKRYNQNMFVILKSLDNPKNIRLEVNKV